MRAKLGVFSAAMLVLGCQGIELGDGGDTGADSASGGIVTTTPADTGAATSSGGPGGSSASGGDSGSDAVDTGGSAGASSTGDGVVGGDDGFGGGGIACDQVLACSDGIDNDGDGKIDSGDPECVAACDDDEASFQTGIPGDNVDCKQDCFFDGNSGQGDDGCVWDLRCDPANPGENVGCGFTGGNQCNNVGDQSQKCIDTCGALTPNGCDCFGCCTVDGPDGPVNIFLNSGPDCALDNLDACATCTPSTDCNNGCDADNCELCFGQDELPEGCEEATCEAGQQSCEVSENCPEGQLCVTGCCVDYVTPG